MLFDNDIDSEEIEKTFDHITGTEVEDSPNNNKYLKWLQTHNRAWKINGIRNELRRIKNGRMLDQEKIDILKNDLFWAVQDDKPTEKIVEAIAIIQECKTNDENTEAKRQNNFTSQFNAVFGYMIMLGIVATVFSYVALPLCKNSHSKFCTTARVIPNLISDFYREPVSHVLPK